MPAPAPVASPLSPIVTAVQTQLAAVTGLNSNLILFAQRADTPHFQGLQDVVLRVGPPRPVEGFSDGSGRVAVVVSRVLQVTPRTRWGADQSDRDDLWLTDPTYGHLALEENCVNALHIWMPGDSVGNLWLQEPIHWAPGAEPVRETPESQSWGHTDLMFEMKYLLPVSANTF